MVFVLSFGSYTVITSRGLALDVGQMSSMLTYSFQILMSLMMLSMVFVMITMASESAQRIVEVLCEESALQSPENPVREVKDGSIDFDNVSFKYAKTAERWRFPALTCTFVPARPSALSAARARPNPR